jgi:hypothetical protein
MIVALWTSPVTASGTSQAVTELVSVATGGQQGNDISGRFAGPAISANGQVVAFDSAASTLVPGDTNGQADVFVHDRSTGSTERVSVSTAGVQGNDFSSRPALDGSGNLVVFDSGASNLVTGDTNHALDVFVHDRAAGTTERISVSSSGLQGNGQSNSPSMSDDGRFVSFISSASNLVHNDTNGVEDVFVRDLVAGTTELVSITSSGQQANSSTTEASISADGRWVAFSSFATNLVPGDTNGHFDVFIHDRQTGLTELVSVSSDETQGDAQSTTPSVSGDGQVVAFWSQATNLVPGDTNGRPDVFVRDRVAGTTERASVSSDEQQGDGNSPEAGVRGFVAEGPDITPDGRFVAFSSSSTNLVPGDTNTCPLFFDQFPGQCPDAFVRDRVAGTTERVNVASDGTQANDRTVDPAISDDGSVVAFFSAAGNLVPNDTNTCPGFSAFPGNCPDIFLHDTGGTSSGPNYTFTTLIDSTDGFDPSEFGCPAINDVGQVAERVATTSGKQLIVRVDGSRRIIASSGPLFSFLGRNPSINIRGAVSFAANLADGSESILRGSGGQVTTVASTTGQFDFFGFDASVNDSARVAFKAELDDFDQGMFSGTGGPLKTYYLASSSKFAGDDAGPSINELGTVAFEEFLDGGGEGIFLARKGGFVTIATTNGPFGFVEKPSLNNQDVVAFRAFLDGGRAAIVEGDGTSAPTVIADTGGAFSDFGFNGPSLNDQGQVVFPATLDSGQQGIFAGPDPVTDKVVESGDVIGGRTVASVFSCREALNDQGQVVFVAQFADGTAAVIRATPA